MCACDSHAGRRTVPYFSRGLCGGDRARALLATVLNISMDCSWAYEAPFARRTWRRGPSRRQVRKLYRRVDVAHTGIANWHPRNGGWQYRGWGREGTNWEREKAEEEDCEDEEREGEEMGGRKARGRKVEEGEDEEPARSYSMVLASMRNVRITCEQPLNSLFYNLPSVQAAIYMCRLSRHVTWMGGWGGLTIKPDEFYSNLAKPKVALLIKTYREARARVGRTQENNRTTFQTKKASGNSFWVNGRRQALKRSARYPPGFTLALSDLACNGLSAQAARAARAV